MKRRRGISQLLATIITVGIVIALGGFLWAWTVGLFKTGAAVAEVTIVDASIVISPTGGQALSVTVRNTGTVTATKIEITEMGGKLTSGGAALRITFSDLAPGKSAGTTVPLDNAESGKTYIFRVSVDFADGSHRDFTFTVRAQMAA